MALVKAKLSLHEAFHYEAFDQIESLLNECNSLEELLQKDQNGKLAWECEDVPEKYLVMVVDRWLQLNESARSTTVPNEYCKHVAQKIALNRLNSPLELEQQLPLYRAEEIGFSLKDIFDNVNNYIGLVSILLVAANKMYGAKTLLLDFQLNMFVPFLMAISALIRTYEIYNHTRKLDFNNILELGFIYLSLALTIASIVKDSHPLMVIGATASVMQSMFEFISAYKNYCEVPEGTDRKMAYKQKLVEQTANMLQNLISLAFVFLMISGNLSLMPVMLSISVIILVDIAWKLAPKETKNKLKTSLGFGKSSYGFFTSKEKIEVVLKAKEEQENSDEEQLLEELLTPGLSSR